MPPGVQEEVLLRSDLATDRRPRPCARWSQGCLKGLSEQGARLLFYSTNLGSKLTQRGGARSPALPA